MSSTFVGASMPNVQSPAATQKVEVNLYIGVFFDGTNNNMVQSMVAQHFRRKQAWKDSKKKVKEYNAKHPGDEVNDVDEALQRPRSYWEGLGADSPFTPSQLDRMYAVGETVGKEIENQIAAGNDSSRWSAPIEDNSSKGANKYLNDIAASDAERSLFSSTYWKDKEKKLAFGDTPTYTNPAILESLYKCSTSPEIENELQKTSGTREFHHCLYIEGSGADTSLTSVEHYGGFGSDLLTIGKNGVAAVIADFQQKAGGPGKAPDGSITGLAFGVGSYGITAKCRRMANQIKSLYFKYATPEVSTINITFDVFGFSRGSATARMFTYIVNPNTGNGKYSIPSSDYKLMTGSSDIFLPDSKDSASSLIGKKTVRYLGIFDTVASVGVLRDPMKEIVADKISLAECEEFKDYGKSIYHDDNSSDFGLYATEKAEHLLHICALDEHRVNFSLTDIENSLSTGSEVFIPGCHSDIGGGASLGQDSIKIINRNFIANKDQIFNEAYSKAQSAYAVAKDVIAATKATLETVKHVKNVVESVGAAIETGGLAAVPAALVALKEARAAYKSAKDALISANAAAHKVKDDFTTANSQLNTLSGAVPQTEIDKLKRKGIVEELEEIAAPIKDATQKAKDSINIAKGGAQGVAQNVSDITDIFKDKDRDKGDLIGEFGKLAKNSKDTVTGTVDTLNSIHDAVDGINKGCSRIKARYTTATGQQMNAMQAISSEIQATVDEMKALYNVTADTINCIKDIVNSPKTPLITKIDKRALNVYNTNPFADVSDDSTLLHVSSRALREMGWNLRRIPDFDPSGRRYNGRVPKEYLAEHDSETIIVDGTKTFMKEIENVAIYKYSRAGYTNVALNAMHKWAGDDAIFNPMPPGRYDVPADLAAFSSAINAQTRKPGRHFCVPADYEEYRHIRWKYLHFSCNQQIMSPADNGLVNGLSLRPINGIPTRANELLIIRRIYKGTNSNNGKDEYLCDYPDSGLVSIPVKITLPNPALDIK